MHLGKAKADRRKPRSPALKPACDPLESRALLSGPGSLGHHAPAGQHVHVAAFSGAGASAFLIAVNSPGASEFRTLIHRQVPNVFAVGVRFATGQISEFSTPGFYVKTPKFQDQYRGPGFDQFNITAAGAVYAPKEGLVLGGIMRGQIDQATPVTYVFGIDRGGPNAVAPFASRPGIRYDATVAVHVSNGQATAAEVTDLSSGKVTPISTSSVFIQGPTIKVIVDPNLLPSPSGVPLKQYKFDLWTTAGGTTDITQIGSFAPDQASLRIGVLPGRAPRLPRKHR